MDLRLSSTGRTKQAESRPSSVPAFISVGEFGTNSSLRMLAANSSAQR
jgi:hypothetical protein